MLALVSIAVAALAVTRIVGWAPSDEVDPSWWVFAVVGAVLAIDLGRTVVSLRTRSVQQRGAALERAPLRQRLRRHARRPRRSDRRGGRLPRGDSIAALFVAVLVLVAAARLIRRNIDVLMDSAPADVEDAARTAIARSSRRCSSSGSGSARRRGGRSRTRSSRCPPAPRSARGTRPRIASRRSSSGCCPGSTSSSTSSRTGRGGAARARPRGGALGAAGARDPQSQRRLARRADRALAAPQAARRPPTRGGARDRGAGGAGDRPRRPRDRLGPDAPRAARRGGLGEEVEAAEIERAVERAVGGPPRELRLLRTEKGVVAFLTLGLDPGSTLAEAHARASEVEERLARARPDVADVIVHTEP